MTMEIRSYVALGDSFTEGLDDPTAVGGGYRGWADRFAEHLAAIQPGLCYANLAVRGRPWARSRTSRSRRPSNSGQTWSASPRVATTCSARARTPTRWRSPSTR